tara:strand:- start:2 stop:124 length:123 start_codon:yes stop_codon:yes gene_type:complete
MNNLGIIKSEIRLKIINGDPMLYVNNPKYNKKKPIIVTGA